MKINQDLQIKLQNFRRDRRAFKSFVLLFSFFLISLPAEFLCNVRPLIIVVDGKPYFPILFSYSEKDFGGVLPSEPDYLSSHFMLLVKGEPEPSVASAETKSDSTPTGFSLGLDDFEDSSSKSVKSGEPPIPKFSVELGDFDEKPAAPSVGTSASKGPRPFSVEPGDFEDGGGKAESSASASAPVPPAIALPDHPRKVWILWPPIRYDYKYIPAESQSGKVVLAAPYATPDTLKSRTVPSSWVDGHYLGTDDRGRDVLARLIYGFRISMIFGISLAITGTLLGCLIGGVQGFFGGWVDLIGQRLTEIWGSMPRLYILIILSAFLVPSALILFVILNLTAWMGIAAYIRAEFLKIRNFEFVKAAKAMGVSNFKIMRRHILPNALTPVVTFFPFEVTAGILALVSLDYLNLGVPSPAPSMGELLAQGKNNLQAIWIILPTFVVLTTALTLLTFVGEGIRNAFDPRRS